MPTCNFPQALAVDPVEGPGDLVETFDEFTVVDYYGRCEVLFNERSKKWEMVESLLNQRVVLDDGYQEWLLDASEDAGCYLVSVGSEKPPRDIAVADAVTHLVMHRFSDGRKLVRSSTATGYTLRTIQEAKAAHKNFTLAHPCALSAAFDCLKCSCLVFPRGGHKNLCRGGVSVGSSSSEERGANARWICLPSVSVLEPVAC